MALVVSATSKTYSGFAPTSIPGCALWLDAGDPSSLTLSGTNVTAWRDKSPNPITLTVTGTPTYSSNAVQFTGTQSFVNSNSSFNMATMTIFLVGYNTTGITGSAGFVSLVPIANGTDWNQSNAITYNFSPTLGQLYTTYNFDVTGTNDVYTSTTNPILFCHVQSNTSFTLYGSGTSFSTRTFAASPGITTGIAVGVRYQHGDGTPSALYRGSMNEILLYSNALTNAERQEVEGYLARKWNLQSSLPATHPYKSLPVLTRPFLPLDISGTSLWYDAADQRTLTLTAQQRVIQWNDRSGNGQNATQFVSAPNYGSNAVQFATGQGLSNALSASTNVESGFVVARWASVSGAQTMLGAATGGTSLNGGRQFRISNARLEAVSQGRTLIRTGTLAVASNTTYLTEYVNTGTVLSLYLNGNFDASATSVTYLSPRLTAFGIREGGTESMNGTMFEVVVYSNALVDASRQLVEGYLAWKWGTQSGLPAAHPYKSAAPADFVPTSLTGCALWLDSSDQTTLVVRNPLTAILDKSGNGCNASVFCNAPYWTSNDIQFRSSIGQGLSSAVTASSITESALIVTRVTTPSVGLNTLLGENLNSARQFRISNSVLQTFRQNSSNILSGGTVAADTPCLVGFVSTQGGTVTHFIDSSAVASGPAATAYTGTRATRIGARGAGAIEALTGSIFELLIWTGYSLTQSDREQLEGYLMDKWKLRSRLPATHPFRQSLPATPPFHPLQLAGCVLWLDAADPSTLTLSGSSVTAWNDKSGNGANVTTITGTVTFSNSGVSIVTSDSYVTGSFGASDYTGTTLSCFAVATMNSGSGSVGRLLSLGKVGTQDSTNLESFVAVARLSGGLGIRTVRNNQTQASPPSIPAYATRFLTSSGQTASSQFISVNGGTVATASITGAFAINSYRIGSDLLPDSATEQYSGVVNEIVVYFTELTTVQHRQVEGYLAAKWGLKTSLPTTHAFRTITP